MGSRGGKKRSSGRVQTAYQRYRSKLAAIQKKHLDSLPVQSAAKTPSIEVKEDATGGSAVKPLVDLVMHFDGSCNPNPGGRMGYGWSVATADGEPVADDSGEVTGRPSHEATNNTAEFEALLSGLRWAANYRQATINTLTVRGDSQLVVRIVNGEWRAKKPHLRLLAERCVRQAKEIECGDLVIEWVPREENKTADRLSTHYHRG